MASINITNGERELCVADWYYEKLDKSVWKPVGGKTAPAPKAKEPSKEEILDEASEIEDKVELDEFAEEHNVELDRRQSKEDMMEELEETLEAKAEEGIPEDLKCPHCGSTARTKKSYEKNHGVNCHRYLKTK